MAFIYISWAVGRLAHFILEGTMINRGNGERPYIHSNINRFNGRKTISLSDLIVTEMEVVESVNILENISQQLKQEADKFLMGMDVGTANAELLRLPNTYAGLATDIIQNRNIITSLLVSSSEGYIKKTELENILNKKEDQVAQLVLQEIGSLDDQVSVEKISKIIAKAMGNAEGVLSETGFKITKFFEFDKSASNKIVEEYTDKMFKNLRSSRGKIVQIIKELLLSSNISYKNDNSQLQNSVDQFMAAFSTEFLQRASTEIDFFYVDFSPEQYLKNLREELETAITKDLTEMRNAVGLINEDILAAVYKADTSVTLTLTATGTKTEDQIISEFPSLRRMNTHHSYTKQSQSDVVIENKNGMVVRAQSKTSLREFEYTVDNKSTMRILNHLQRTVNIYKLLVSLNETGMFPINNIDDICYVIANSLWFNTHISISGEREVGHFAKNSAPQPEVLTEVVNALNIALARQIPFFMGISLEKTVDEIKADVKGSNIFYIENGYLVPTYIELNEVIEDLKNYLKGVQNQGTSLKFTIEKQGVSWVYSNAENFWLQKFAHEVYDSAPGFEQGEAAISSISVHGNFNALLKYESYELG